MLISDRHKFIFVHVWKVAGMSIQRALRHATRRWTETPRRLLASMGIAPLARKYAEIAEHASAVELRAQLPADVFNGFFRFAFVRNPWDLEVSLYHYAMAHPGHHKHEQFKAMRGFDEYIAWRVQSRGRLQLDFLADARGQLLMDFVGRFERLQADFRVVCETIGVNANLPHVNSSSHRDYRECYTARTRAMLAAAVRDDIDQFGYEFDGPADSPRRVVA